jgi:hypothetical protein
LLHPDSLLSLSDNIDALSRPINTFDVDSHSSYVDHLVCSRAISAEPAENDEVMKWLEDLNEAQQYEAGSQPITEDVRQLYRLGTNGRVTPEQDACLHELEQHHECLVQVTSPTTHCRPGLD